jgi:hypothetical protein
MRTKFIKQEYLQGKELEYIERMEHTHDTYGLSKETIELFYGLNPRQARYVNEKYNNFVYSNITPQGKIVSINGLYKMIKPDSRYAQRYILKAKFDKLCAILDEYNTRRLLGEVLCNGQEQMEIDRILKEANELEEVLRSIEKLQ